MIQQNTLTGDRKIMNMLKLGIVLHAAQPLKNPENTMNTGLPAIHYAKHIMLFRIRLARLIRL
jgi:hypothetical protein